MTSAPVEAPPRPVLANGRLYFSPLGLFGFQAEAVAQAYFAEGLVGVLDTGLGKTHVSMALAAKLVENDQVDLVIHVAQKNKIDKSEFPADWAQFTALSILVYHGPGRVKRLAKHGVPDVVITTYETGRDDLVTFTGRSGRARQDGALMSALGLRDKRVLWLFDEISSKLGNRSSKLYRAYEHVLTAQRRGPHPPRVLGLSATPMSTDFEQSFNLGRIVWPQRMPSVEYFEDELTYGRDDHGRLIYKGGNRLVRHPVRAVDLSQAAHRPGHGRADARADGEGDPGRSEQRASGAVQSRWRPLRRRPDSSSGGSATDGAAAGCGPSPGTAA